MDKGLQREDCGPPKEKEGFRMKRGLVWVLALALMLTLAGCGAASGETAASDSAAMDTATAETGFDSGGGMNGAMGMAPMESQEAQEGGGTDSRLQDAKMIYTMDMQVETTAFDDAAAGLRQLVEDMGGYFETASVYNYGGDYRSAYYTIRVPAEQYQNLLTQVGKLCHIVRQEENSQNISEQYYDTESRLVTQQTKLERLQTLLAQAETMEDIITIESAISDTELTIEQLTGTLRSYDSLVDYSTVNISLEEVYQLSNVEEPAQGFASRMGAAFRSGWNGFVDVLEGLAVLLAYIWVPVVVLAVGGVIAWRVIRRRRARESAAQTEEHK